MTTIAQQIANQLDNDGSKFLDADGTRPSCDWCGATDNAIVDHTDIGEAVCCDCDDIALREAEGQREQNEISSAALAKLHE